MVEQGKFAAEIAGLDKKQPYFTTIDGKINALKAAFKQKTNAVFMLTRLQHNRAPRQLFHGRHLGEREHTAGWQQFQQRKESEELGGNYHSGGSALVGRDRLAQRNGDYKCLSCNGKCSFYNRM
jgi:hypothetical protein